jgi:hypothetical protein
LVHAVLEILILMTESKCTPKLLGESVKVLDV